MKYDAIVVGTGAGGGTIGFSLAKKGLKVLFIEKGANYLNGLKGDYTESFKANDNQKWEYLLKNSGRDFDKVVENRRTKIPFLGSGTGGSTALYGMAMERFSKDDFNPHQIDTLKQKSNLPSDGWPISYKELLPFYLEAERLYQVRGTEDPLKNGDSFNYLKPPKLNDSNKELYEFFKDKGLNPYILPRACNFVDGCIECQGFLCPLNCKNDSFNTCVKPSIEKYGAKLIDNAEVTKVHYKNDKIIGIEYLKNDKIEFISSQIYILALGAIRTPVLMLSSDNLSNSSGLVGKNLMRHCIDLFLVKTKIKPPSDGFLKEIALNDLYSTKNNRLGTFQSFGRIPPSKIILENIFNSTITPLIIPIEKLMDYFLSFFLPMNSIIEDLPYLTNYITLHSDRKTPKINFQLNEYEKHQISLSRKTIKKLLGAKKSILIRQAEDNKRLAHVCGTCRMGTDKKTSVVNENCRSHEIKNLYIADASIFPTSGGTNPALTIIANSLRIAKNIT